MKKLFIFILCISLLGVNTLAADEVTDTTTETTEQPTVIESTTQTPSTAASITTTVSTTQAPKTTQAVTQAVEKPAEKYEEPLTEAPVDNSQPRLMVTSYKLENDFIAPNETKKLTITLKNMHSSKQVKNIKLSVAEDTDEIRPTEMGTKYVSSIGAEKYYSWVVELTAVNIAAIGEHKLSFTTEYEDENGSGYSANDVLRLQVRQPAKLQYDGAKLPVKVVQDDTVTLNIKLMNTGKAPLYNCKVDYNIKGLESGGCAFVGEIQPQESGNASSNLLVSGTLTGKVDGTITISYEDAFGETFTLTEDVTTKIEKKVIKAQKQNDEEKEKKNPLWWLFLLIGGATGGALGFFIPYAIRSRKERLIDEERL